jgi:hypothetical protein
MVGVGLGRLWNTHPRVAFVFHLCLTLLLGGVAVWFVVSGTDGWAVLIVTAAFAVMALLLVFFTWLAIEDRWQPDNSSYGTEGQGRLVNPGAAWANTQAQARILWLLFAASFLFGLVLLASNTGVGATLIALSLPLAAVAIRAGR